MMQVTRTLNERISGYCQVTLETMAYAGTGDVLKVQKMLSIVGEHVEIEEGEEWKVGPIQTHAHRGRRCILIHWKITIGNFAHHHRTLLVLIKKCGCAQIAGSGSDRRNLRSGPWDIYFEWLHMFTGYTC
jgi:hypothetical protein